MSPPRPGPRLPGWRTVNATLSGVLVGTVALVLARGPVGSDLGLRATLVGIATVGGAACSLVLSSPERRRARRERRRMRPLHWGTPVMGSVVAILVWGAVAHSSGSGWVQALGAVMAAVLVVGLLAPMVPTRRASVRCTSSPSDGSAGTSVVVRMVASGPLRITPRRPGGPPVRAGGPTRGEREIDVALTPRRRGVLHTVAVEVASCSPFGLLWWGREVEVALPRPLHVAPRIGEPGPMASGLDASSGEAPRWVPSEVGEVRGVRPYRSGDSRRWVHWPATAHVGSLMVREQERRTDDPIAIDLVLPDDPGEAEQVAERAMAVIVGHLSAGQPVVLGTTEPEGHRWQGVRDRVDLGRRLARAVPPPAGAPQVRAPDSPGRPR